MGSKIVGMDILPPRTIPRAVGTVWGGDTLPFPLSASHSRPLPSLRLQIDFSLQSTEIMIRPREPGSPP